jgi:hypothetical protein
MSERSEFRSRREERMENGVKNPIGSEAISQTFPNLLDSIEVVYYKRFFMTLSQIKSL